MFLHSLDPMYFFGKRSVAQLDLLRNYTTAEITYA